MDDSIFRFNISQNYLRSIDVDLSISDFYFEFSSLESANFLSILEITWECFSRNHMKCEDIYEITFFLRGK